MVVFALEIIITALRSPFLERAGGAEGPVQRFTAVRAFLAVHVAVALLSGVEAGADPVVAVLTHTHEVFLTVSSRVKPSLKTGP
jgi:hypothetical protein